MPVLRALVPAVILLIGAHEARADKKVDWGEFLEKPGDRPLQIKHEPVAQKEASPKAKAAPAAKAKPAKAKAKRPAAKGKHR